MNASHVDSLGALSVPAEEDIRPPRTEMAVEVAVAVATGMLKHEQALESACAVESAARP